MVHGYISNVGRVHRVDVLHSTFVHCGLIWAIQASGLVCATYVSLDDCALGVVTKIHILRLQKEPHFGGVLIYLLTVSNDVDIICIYDN